MRVNVLGPLHVLVDGAQVEVRGRRLRWLLIRPAMEPGRVVAAERLIADLWVDEPPVDGPASLQSRVDSRLRLLDRGARTGPARHRTLRAVIDWSWELLDDAERDLLARLGVFVGGATAAAVHSVCGAGSRRGTPVLGTPAFQRTQDP